MDFAIHRQTNRKIYATNFDNFTLLEQSDIKPFLICSECKQKASFVKRKSDGTIACFKATHVLGCGKGKSNPSSGNELNRVEVNKRIINTDEYKLKLKNFFETEVDSPLEDLFENINKKGKSKRIYSGGTDLREIIKTKSLATILNEVINNRFENDDYVLNIGNEKICISDILCSFNDVNIENKGQWGMFYGYICGTDANTWLNSDEKWSSTKFSIRLDIDFSKVFWSVIPKEWNAPIPTIVCGELKISKSNKPYITVDNPASLYLKIKRKKQ